jgi:hypothetical protein
MRRLYRLCVQNLGRLPYEVVRDAPPHQLLLGMALLAIEEEDAARALHARMREARTPPKWRKIHASLDRAARAMGHQN